MLDILKSNNFKTLILAAVIIRLFLATFFYHPDLRVYFFHGQFLSQGITNIYSFLEQNRSHLPNSNRFNYPPLTYFFFGSWHAISSFIAGPGLNSWLNDWSSKDIYHPELYFYLLLLKLPYFFIDFLALSALLVLSPPNKKYLMAVLWLFNPITLYGTYVVGQFDILPTWLTLLALIYLEKKQLYKTLSILVIAGLLKSYPLLFIPFVLLRAGSVKKFIHLSLFAVFLWGLIQLPFIMSPGYSESVFTSGLATRVINSTLSLGSNINISPFVVTLVILFIYSLFAKVSARYQFLVITLSVILFASFHAQWLIWFLPFALLLWVEQKHFWAQPLLITCSAFILILLLPDKFTLVGLFVGLNPYLVSIPSLPEIITPSTATTLSTLARSVLVSTGIWSIYAASKA